MDNKSRKDSLQHSIKKPIVTRPSKQGEIIPNPKPPRRPPEGKGKK